MPITSMRPSLAVDRSSVTLERQGPEFLQTDYRKSRKTEISSPFPLNGGGGARRVENAWLEKRDRSPLDFANKMRNGRAYMRKRPVTQRSFSTDRSATFKDEQRQHRARSRSGGGVARRGEPRLQWRLQWRRWGNWGARGVGGKETSASRSCEALRARSWRSNPSDRKLV